MKKGVLAICVLMLIGLLSCDVDNIDALLSKTREKFVDKKKDKKGLGIIDKVQEGIKEQRDVIQKNLKTRENQVLQTVSVESVNAESPMILNVPYYYPQKEIEIKEEDLIPSTDGEKEAQKEIDKIENILGNSEFDKLIEDTRKIKSEYEKLESSFYNTFLELKKIRESYPRNNKVKNQELVQLAKQISDNRGDIDNFKVQLYRGFEERMSAKYFFEKAKKTLKEAITKRLRNKHRSYWSRRQKVDVDLLVKQARIEAENALSQLESASSKVGEVIGRKKDIEELIENAKSILENLER